MLIIKFLSENGKTEDGCIANDGMEMIKRAFVVMYVDGIGCLSTSHMVQNIKNDPSSFLHHQDSLHDMKIEIYGMLQMKWKHTYKT